MQDNDKNERKQERAAQDPFLFSCFLFVSYSMELWSSKNPAVAVAVVVCGMDCKNESDGCIVMTFLW